MNSTPQPDRPKRKIGRPTTYTPELHAAICESVGNGASLTTTLKANGVAMSSFFQWLRAQPSLAEDYARAEDARGQVIAEELLEIADQAVDGESAQAVRVRVDARKWAASHLAPKRWGDRVGVEHSGKDGEPLKVVVEVIGGAE